MVSIISCRVSQAHQPPGAEIRWNFVNIFFVNTTEMYFFHNFYNGRGFICVQMLRKMCTAYCLMTDLDPLEFLGYLLLFTRQK